MATAAAGALVVGSGISASRAADAPPAVAKKIRQSIMGWCFQPMPVLELAQHCKNLGMEAMEGISPKFYPDIKKLGLKVSLVGSHGFKDGPCIAENHDMCSEKIRSGIDLAVSVECPSVITFTGMRAKGLTDKQMDDNCVEFWKNACKYAEEKKISLCLEHLNSRDDSHPMKGHPGYFGDDVDHCVDLIRRVDSKSMKLLFDVYHVQIMNGDVIRRLRQYQDLIGHYHTAGNPGRGELDDTQEINYPAVMRAILETGYD
ncbi:MAG: hydroxypyruvate isomerase, partial [Pirellulaceae bacterium]